MRVRLAEVCGDASRRRSCEQGESFGGSSPEGPDEYIFAPNAVLPRSSLLRQNCSWCLFEFLGLATSTASGSRVAKMFEITCKRS